MISSITKTIKALKTLVWHLSRKPMKEMSFLKKINTMICDEQVWTNTLWDELIWRLTPSGDNHWCIIAPIERHSGYRDFQ